MAQDVSAFAERAKRDAGMLALAALFALTAYLFLLAALALWLAESLGPAGGVFIVGAGLAVLAGGTLLWLRSVRAEERRERQRRLAASTSRAALIGAATALVPSLFKSKRLLGLAAAAGVAAWLFARSRGSDAGPEGDA